MSTTMPVPAGKPSAPRAVRTRSELLSLLTEACELEHGLACSYLFSAFSIKQDLSEGGITWQQLQLARKWAGQVYFVASQEMLHLAQVWNLLTAIGGVPYYGRPNFPQNSKYYPIHVPLKLEPFGIAALERFIRYEKPHDLQPDSDFSKKNAKWIMTEAASADDTPSFTTVGGLYALVREAFQALPEAELFVGRPDCQVGADLVDFPNLVPVVDRRSAIQAIDEITEQGEGTPADRADSHYGTFITAHTELAEARTQDPSFAPARDCLSNPVARLRPDYCVSDLAQIADRVIQNEFTKEASLLFDDIYLLMLRLLAYVFSNSTGDRGLLKRLSTTVIRMMLTVVQPLGEALTSMPAGGKHGTKTAGPSFGLTRHIPLPADPGIALTLVRERLRELAATADRQQSHPTAPDGLRRASRGLANLSADLT